MTRWPLGAWRLLRCVLHAVHGVLLVLLCFKRCDVARRHHHIRWWAQKMLRVMGLRLKVQGQIAEGGTLLVANHVSWLDITALHAVAPHARFVSKADVKAWPVLSHLADAANTLYLERERKRDALRVVHLTAQALAEGDAVAVFPEGTTSDGRSLLPFHANLLQAAIATNTPVQPVALRYSDARGTISATVEFVGNTTLLQSLWRVACADGLTAHLQWLPLQPSAQQERRALAQTLQRQIAEALTISRSDSQT
jgi:1-acyl-sn-glycerol-3-phosphate acyltransferase